MYVCTTRPPRRKGASAAELRRGQRQPKGRADIADQSEGRRNANRTALTSSLQAWAQAALTQSKEKC